MPLWRLQYRPKVCQLLVPVNVYVPIWADAKCLSDRTKPELNKHLRHSYCSLFILSTRLKCNSDVSAESLSHMVQFLSLFLAHSLCALLSLFSHSLLFLLFSLLLLYRTRHCSERKKDDTFSVVLHVLFGVLVILAAAWWQQPLQQSSVQSSLQESYSNRTMTPSASFSVSVSHCRTLQCSHSPC